MPGLLRARLAVIRTVGAVLAFISGLVILSLMFATPLLALPAIISLSPSNGYAGSTVSLSGTIDTANGAYRVRWETTTGDIIQSGIASGTSVYVFFTVPAAARGAHNVFLEDATTNATASSPFMVNPLITISPTSGAAGTVVTVTGSGFAASEANITITWDNIPIASVLSANTAGGWSTSFGIAPTATAGSHIIDAYGASTTAGVVPDVTFMVSAPQININPTSGIVGSTVSVSASGFFPSESGITVTYDGETVASGITANSGGSWATTFTVPESASGIAHEIDAYGAKTAATGVTPRTFNVTPKISISPASGNVGTTVTVSATGFRAGEASIAITYDGSVVRSGIVANALGSWSSTFAIPDSASGTRTVDAYGDYTVATSVPDIGFTPTPSITVTPASGAPGTVITVTGTGFVAAETGITVTFGGTVVKDGISASNKGSWNVTFPVPTTAGGNRRVSAYGSMTSAASIRESVFVVMAKVTANPASGVVGTKITVTGASFGANESGISLTYDGVAVSNNLNADANGGWTTTFTVPASVTSNHVISAFGNVTTPKGVVEASFNIVPDISINPNSGFVGTIVTITGKGFAASKAVTVNYDGEAVTTSPGTPTTSAQGSFSVTFTAPRSKGGAHKITVSDGYSSRDADWSMDSTPPPAPVVNSTSGQITGIFGNVPVTLSWSEVTDSSGVYYSLQVDTSPDFTAPFIKEEGLTKTTYTTGKLAMGTYYWRVKAVDGAYNESPWSTTAVAKVGLIPFAVFIIIIVFGFLVIVGAVISFVRRRSKPAPKPNAG